MRKIQNKRLDALKALQVPYSQKVRACQLLHKRTKLKLQLQSKQRKFQNYISVLTGEWRNWRAPCFHENESVVGQSRRGSMIFARKKYFDKSQMSPTCVMVFHDTIKNPFKDGQFFTHIAVNTFTSSHMCTKYRATKRATWHSRLQ